MVNLLPYETQDLIEHIQKPTTQSDHSSGVGMGPLCKQRFKTQTVAWVQAEASIEREQWGIRLPQGRVIVEIPD